MSFRRHRNCRPSNIREVLCNNICRCVTIILDSGETERLRIKAIRRCLLIAEIDDCADKFVDIRKITAVIVHDEGEHEHRR